MAYQNWRPSYPPVPQNGAGNYYQQPLPPPRAPPPAVAQDDRFRPYYADRLRQLTFNSKPLIQELSVMAMQQRDGNNWDTMKAVVEEIETAVLRVRVFWFQTVVVVSHPNFGRDDQDFSDSRHLLKQSCRCCISSTRFPRTSALLTPPISYLRSSHDYTPRRIGKSTVTPNLVWTRS